MSAAAEIMPETNFCAEHKKTYPCKVLIGGKWYDSPCPDCRKKKSELADRQEQKMNESRRILLTQSRMRCAQIPPRYEAVDLSGLKAINDPSRRIYRSAYSYAKNFAANRERGTSLILHGGVGTGKTHTACAILSKAINSGFSGLYTRFPAMMREVKQTYKSGADVTESEALWKFTHPDLLVVDEIGIGHGTAYEEITLSEIMSMRYDELKPTILVSNLSLAEITSSVGDRVVSRMSDRGGMVFHFDWESFRG